MKRAIGADCIARRELIEHAFEQWPLATIKAALSRAEWTALVDS
jgi:hypothetical protein